MHRTSSMWRCVSVLFVSLCWNHVRDELPLNNVKRECKLKIYCVFTSAFEICIMEKLAKIKDYVGRKKTQSERQHNTNTHNNRISLHARFIYIWFRHKKSNKSRSLSLSHSLVMLKATRHISTKLLFSPSNCFATRFVTPPHSMLWIYRIKIHCLLCFACHLTLLPAVAFQTEKLANVELQWCCTLHKLESGFFL